jgi:1-phosphofructokinase family hexose kinase
MVPGAMSTLAWTCLTHVTGCLRKRRHGTLSIYQGGFVDTDDRIVTVGLAPAWDISCRGRDFDWGRHAEMDDQTIRPAGKALNVSYALAWMGLESVAAGLWGREDYDEMQEAISRLGGLIEVEMTTAEGRTRQNITIVDTLHHREMHLRRKSDLASDRSLHRLNVDLSRLIREGDTCVFAGAVPGGALLDPAVDLVWTCRLSGARVAVDTHGPALKAIVEAGLPWLIAPNVGELRELLGSQVEDSPARLMEAGRTLLGRLEMTLISRGENGALIVTKGGAWTGCSRIQDKVLSTVGCGDYLLAGFLAGLQETGDPCAALARALKVATARAWGWTEVKAWSQIDKEIAVAVEAV